MDTQYQTLIKDILNEYAKYKPAFGEIDSRVSFDDEHGTYALLQVGWNGDEYVNVASSVTSFHGAVIHVDIIEDKIWIQYDGSEEGIAVDLVEKGVPKETIVLGFRPPEERPYTSFAVA
jgi:hypothetical protein